MRKPLISLTLWTLGLGSAAAAACSSPDPGVNYAATSPTSFSAQDSGSGAVGNPNTGAMSNDAGSTSVVTGTDSGGGTIAANDAGDAPHVSAEAGEGGSGGGDGGALAGFLGETTAWATSLPAVTAFSSHQGAGQPQQTPQMDCLSCHVTGGLGVPFLAAGFVATAAGGTTGAADVEARVYASGGSAGGYSAHTDTNGYFWINPPLGGTTGPYSAGLRSKTTTVLMPVTQTMTDCQSSSCHGGATPGVLHIP